MTQPVTQEQATDEDKTEDGSAWPVVLGFVILGLLSTWIIICR